MSTQKTKKKDDRLEIPDMLSKLTPADAEEIHNELGRPWTDINHCILAFQADNTANQLASIEHKDIKIMLLMGSPSQDLNFLHSILVEVASRHGDDPFVVRSEAVKQMKQTAADAGDYLTFLSFVEYLLRRKEEPEIEWSLFRVSNSSMDVALSLITRLETTSGGEGQVKDLLDGQPPLKGEGGNPLPQQKE